MRSSDSLPRGSSGAGVGGRRTLSLLLLPVTIVALLAAVYMGLTVSSALRGYVAAFGRWTQEQKTGIQQLNRFAVTHSERDYDRYVEAQRVPDGGRVAWVALTQPEPDVGAATEGFIAGGADPEDASDMAHMFRWLSPLTYFRHVADLWPEADAGRAQTDQQARTLRDLIRAGARDTARIRAVLDSIDATDARISKIERDFATSIGVGARAMTSAILYATILIGIVLMIVGTIIGMRLYQHERASVEVVHQRAEEFRALVENAPDIIVRFGRDLRVTYVNPAVERVAGIPPLTVVGHAADALHIADGRAAELEAVVLDVFGSGRDGTIELDLETSRGMRSFQVRLTSERAPDRSIEAVLAIASDITELKASERALREQDDKIRHVQKMEAVGRLASGVAHEFNNLLTVLAGSLDLAREEIGRGGDALREIGTARQAADRAYGLTRQLLLFNRRDVSRLRIVPVTDTVRQLESVFSRVIGEHLTVETSLDAETPDVRMDRGDLEQIVLNLAINARDAMPEGGRLRIATRGTTEPPANASTTGGAPGPVADRWLVLEVSDTGAALDAETQAHLFEPFFSARRDDEGSGLGLSTTYGIVRSYGGQIVVDTAPGEGSTFRVFLPGAQVTPDDAGALARPARGSESVLIMEDEPAVRDLTQRVLARQGYSVTAASNGEEALARWDEHDGKFDLVLSDVVSPVMGGRGLAAGLGQRGADIPMVFMSGYTDSDLPLRGARGEIAPLLAKPFTTDELLTIVRRALDETT